MHAILDADTIVWKASAAAEIRIWEAFNEDGTLAFSFPGMLKKDIIKLYPDLAGSLKVRVESQPVEHALQIAKQLVGRIYESLVKHTGGTLESYVLILSALGKNCFRYGVAKTIGYKSKRPAGKPEHWEAVRKYLIEHWGARIAPEHLEADDAIAILATTPGQRYSSIIVSTDKDLRTIPGHNFNYDKDIYQCITYEEATDNLVLQMLTGDSADSIPGLKGVGPVKANELLEEWRAEARRTMPHPHTYATEYRQFMLERVKMYYIETGYKEEYYHEMYTLLKILTYDDEIEGGTNGKEDT